MSGTAREPDVERGRVYTTSGGAGAGPLLPAPPQPLPDGGGRRTPARYARCARLLVGLLVLGSVAVVGSEVQRPVSVSSPPREPLDSPRPSSPDTGAGEAGTRESSSPGADDTVKKLGLPDGAPELSMGRVAQRTAEFAKSDPGADSRADISADMEQWTKVGQVATQIQNDILTPAKQERHHLLGGISDLVLLDGDDTSAALHPDSTAQVNKPPERVLACLRRFKERLRRAAQSR